MSANVLSVAHGSKVYGARRVLDGVSFTVAPGRRLGLVGENGAGKTTLLRLLAGLEEPDHGEVERPAEVGFLHQELPYPATATVADIVDDALAEVHAARRRLDELAEQLRHTPDDAAALTAYGELLSWADDHDLWGADRRAELVLAGLGLAAVARAQPAGELSGGQRARLALAALLIRQPQALLLDEPTNHLDDDAIGFLETHLTRLPGAVVLASHDRMFLDAVCTGILDLDPSRAGVTYYGGTYTDYLQAKRIERRRWEEQYADEQQQIAALRQQITTTARQVAPHREMRDRNKPAYDRRGGRVEAQVSRRVRNARQRLDVLTRTQVRRPPEPLRFHAVISSSGQDDGVVVSMRRVSVPDRVEVDHLYLPATGRLLVTGPNGAGKSTLLALIAGQLAPATGTVHRRPRLRIGLLGQQTVFPDLTRTPRQVYEVAVPAGAPPLAELGLMAPRDVDRPIGTLSLGQRRRLALALLVADPPHVLLLDEPTNHLSLTLVEELENALRTATGAVVVATHDRWLRRRWSGQRVTITAEHRAVVSED